MMMFLGYNKFMKESAWQDTQKTCMCKPTDVQKSMVTKQTQLRVLRRALSSVVA